MATEHKFCTDDHLQLKPPCRYSNQPLPPYRYLPGVNAHPVRDPAGHSFGHAEVKLPFIDPKKWRENPEYLFGVDLYNHGFWWEAHEAWEGVWHTTDKTGDYGQCLQGLIQIGAAFIKWHLHQPDGLQKLYGIGIGRLQSVLDHREQFLGLTMPILMMQLQQHFKTVLTSPSVWPDPLKGYPFLVLADE